MQIGVQMYTVREHCKTPEALAESMKKVADIGYRHIQLSGVCDYDSDWMREQLRACGLSCEITHFAYDKIVNDTANTLQFHDTIGCKYIGIGSCPHGVNPEGLSKMIDEALPAMEKMAAAGHKFMYHNHHKEFAHFDGRNFLELLCEALTPAQCGITFDTYWAQAGGADPASWLRKLAGRVDCVHFKDMVYEPADKAVRMAPIGMGNMNYPAILAACVDAGVQYAYVEQDHTYGEDPFACLKQSFAYLRAAGLS